MNQIRIDGRLYDLVPVVGDTKVQTNEELKPTGWEKAKKFLQYYIFNAKGVMLEDCDINSPYDEGRYNYGNYFSDEQLTKDMARATSLWLKLNRFAAENQIEKIDWDDRATLKYYIFYGNKGGFGIGHNTFLNNITVHFDSRETAEKAIEEFKDELLWYFTEFKNTRRFE